MADGHYYGMYAGVIIHYVYPMSIYYVLYIVPLM